MIPRFFKDMPKKEDRKMIGEWEIMHSTNTFTFGEKEKVNSYTSTYQAIHYCSYCGQKAESKDIGSSHNHRHEEEIIYFCRCDKAVQEAILKKDKETLQQKMYYVQRDLDNLEKFTTNEVTNQIKYQKEVELLQKKYSINTANKTM